MMLNSLIDGKLASREAPVTFSRQYDAVIVGGGTAGSIAAIHLARRGRRVLVVERLNGLGGTFSAGVFGYYFGNEGGLYEQIDQKIREVKDEGWVPPNGGYHPTLRRYVCEREILDHGGEIAYEAVLTGAYMQGSTLVGVQYWQAGQLWDVGLTIGIDATGEGYLCQLAGAQLTCGREGDGNCQPYSNVRIYYNAVHPGVHGANLDAGYIRQNDACDYSDCLTGSTLDPTYLRDTYTAERLELAMSPLLGIREGMTVVGEERICLRDVLEDRKTERPLYYSYSNVDNHGKDIAFEGQEQNDWLVAMSLWGLNLSWGVPMGALTPKGIGGLLAAGRHLSVKHDMAAQVRMMRDIQKCGEAAAVMADIALEKTLPVGQVPYEAVRERLLATGCLSEENNVGLRDIPPPGDDRVLPMPQGVQEIRERLASDRPGMGMLAAYRAGMRAELCAWLEAPEPNLRANSAITLALLGDASGAEILMELGASRDPYLPKSGRKYNAHRGISAIYALGRLGHAPAASMLLKLLETSHELLDAPIAFDEFIGTAQEYRFQYVSHAVRALLMIARRHGELRAQIVGRVQAYVQAPDFHVEVTLKASNNTLYDMTGRLRRYVQCRLEEMEEKGK